MKSLIVTIALAVLAFAPAALAEDVTYEADLTGITCSGCKASVTSAFKKLSGFKSVTFKEGEKQGTQKAIIVTDGSAELTKKEAVKSLGKMASRYVVQDWSKGGKSNS